MSDAGFISVRNWRAFQHYDPAQRTPPWVKTYTELLHDDAYMGLPVGTALVLHRLWLAYASARCRLRADTKTLTRQLGVRVTRLQLDSLNHAGFIDLVASAELAEGYRAASASRAREEVEVEVDTPYPAERGKIENGNSPRGRGENPRALGTNPRAVAKRTAPERRARTWIANGLADLVPDVHLEDVIADEFGIAEPELVADLAGEARARRTDG